MGSPHFMPMGMFNRGDPSEPMGGPGFPGRGFMAAGTKAMLAVLQRGLPESVRKAVMKVGSGRGIQRYDTAGFQGRSTGFRVSSNVRRALEVLSEDMLRESIITFEKAVVTGHRTIIETITTTDKGNIPTRWGGPVGSPLAGSFTGAVQVQKGGKDIMALAARGNRGNTFSSLQRMGAFYSRQGNNIRGFDAPTVALYLGPEPGLTSNPEHMKKTWAQEFGLDGDSEA